MTLTSRLVGEYSQLHCRPFTTYEGLYRRLNQLKADGLLNRRTMLWSGEFYYYLTQRGAKVLEGDCFPDVPPRALAPVAEALQRHEFELSRFWIKLLRDANRSGIEVRHLWRDGEFSVPISGEGKRRWLIPDGGILLDTGDRRLLYLLEIDRSTQMALGHRPSNRSFRAKLQMYLNVRSQILRHPDVATHDLKGFRLLVICRSEQRLESLLAVAKHLEIETLVGFTCLVRYVNTQNSTAKGWRYRSVSLFDDSLFSFPTRSPPESLPS